MRHHFGRVLTTASVCALAATLAAPAYAQDENCDTLTDADERAACLAALDTEQEIESGQPARGEETLTVTGTRIRQPNITSNVPITSVSLEDLTSQGDVNIGDALNDLPSLRSTFSQANSTRFIGTTGLNLLDLRGLGIERTLVLVNGRRHITSLVGDFIVDVQTIPSDLIERVDIITGGNSAVYGSDAVAGVVNFVLRRDFEGIRLRGQGGVSQEGDRGIQFVSLTAGRNFLDDRANVAINLEYVNAEPLYFVDRPEITGAFDGRCQFNLADVTAGEPPQGDGVPDQQFFCGVHNATIADGGLVPPGPGNFALLSAAQCRNPANVAIASRCVAFGTPQGQPGIFLFDNTGNIQQSPVCFDFRNFASGNYIPCPGAAVTGSTLRNTGQLAPGLDRYTANLLLNFDLSDAFRPFVEAKYVRVNSLQEGQPSFFQNFILDCDNAFLTDANRTQLQSLGWCTPATFNLFPLTRFNVDFGGRRQEVERQTYRVVAGVQGDFNDDWSYEVSFNYGRVDIHLDAFNDLILADLDGNPDGFSLAVDAVRNASGQIVCAVNADADPTNDAPGCVPINLFGFGAPSAAALDFVNTTSFLDSRARQYNAIAFMNGDSSQLFELPGGPVRFVLGAEWRRETAFQEADPLSASGGTFFNAFPVFDPPAFEVLEGFGEIQLPILRDLPFAQELTLSAAARWSDYNTSAGTTFAYNLSGTWAPVRDLRFRGNYSKSVRVPTLGDLFTPLTQNFNFVQDPCDVAFIGNNPNRAANCAALGVPPGFINTVARNVTIEILSGGNPALEEETGKSLTLGMVVTPRWVPGLSLTVDYYRIRVDNLIAVLTAQAILNTCVDLPSIDNQFCAQIFPRDPDGFLQEPALISRGLNFAKQEADGIDVEVAYRRTFDNGHRLNLRGIATYVIRRNNFTSPVDPDFSNRILSEFGDPRWAANLNITYGVGPFDLRYSINYIGRQINPLCVYENFFEHDGRPPSNQDCVADPYITDVMYHSARLNMRVNERFQFYFGVDNLFNTQPPAGQLGVGAGDPFDAVGRYFFAGAQVDF